MPKKKDKPLYVKIAERDDLVDFLGLFPSWIWGALVWYAFSKLVLDSLSPKKPGTEINLAILLASGIIPDMEVIGLPPGVKLAALIDVSLTAIDIGKDLSPWLAYILGMVREDGKVPDFPSSIAATWKKLAELLFSPGTLFTK